MGKIQDAPACKQTNSPSCPMFGTSLCRTASPATSLERTLQWTSSCSPRKLDAGSPSKPDKFGIKFWLAADVDSKYMLNGFPYLGKDESRPPGERLGENVVMRLMEPFLGKGRNVTLDNFFTSVSLAKKLVSNNTSMVGTINKNRPELPPSSQHQGELFTTSVLKHERVTLTVYRSKPRRNVCLLSTLHRTVAVNNDTKREPETVTYYNATKVLDQMARLYSVKGGTRRWPVAVFHNVLDLAAINAHVLYKECTGEKIPRRDFILKLAKGLWEKYLKAKAPATTEPTPKGKGIRMKRQVARCNQNKTCETCQKCKRPVCGKCTWRVKKICADCQ